jgi:hypothetical protein
MGLEDNEQSAGEVRIWKEEVVDCSKVLSLRLFGVRNTRETSVMVVARNPVES